MASFMDFEDINAWRNARKLAANIYQTTNDGKFSRDFSLKDQLRRSSTSVMANIAEGFKRNGTGEIYIFSSHRQGIGWRG